MNLGNNERQQLLVLAQQNVARCIKLADVYFDTAFNMPTVTLSQRGKAAGTAHLQANEIRLNFALYKHNVRDFVNQVIPHEVAHIIAFQHYGRSIRPHGKEWQRIMTDVFAVKPERTHQFDVAVAVKQFSYRCGCQTHLLSVRRHNAIQKATRRYLCRLCKEMLVFQG